MKSLIISVLIAVQAVAMSAQEFKPVADPTKPIIAVWGSSKAEVMQAAKNKGLKIFEFKEDDGKGMSHITYMTGDTARMFTFYTDKFVVYTHMYFQHAKHKIDKFIATQVEYYANYNPDATVGNAFNVKTEQGEITINIEEGDGNATVRMRNSTVAADAVREMVRKGY